MALQRKTRRKSKSEPLDQNRIDAEKILMDRTAAAALIEEWLSDNSGYDEAVWPVLQIDIEANRLAQRPRFHE